MEFYAISSFASPIKKSAKNILLTYPYDFVEVYDFFSLIYNFPFLTILSTSGSQCVVPRLITKKREKTEIDRIRNEIRNEKGEVTTDTAEIQRIMRD